MSESNRPHAGPRTGQKRSSRAEQARARYIAEAQQPPAPRGRSSPTAQAKPGLRIAVALLYPLVLLSLGLNVMLIRQLQAARDQVYVAVDQAVSQVLTMTNEIANEVITVHIQIDEEFPVSVSVPFEYNTVFPIAMDVPIKTTFSVPFEVMDTVINLDVPIDMSVPINYEVPVSLEKTFEISTTVPVKFDINVVIDLQDTPLPKYLEDLRTAAKGIQAQVQETPSEP